MEQLYRYRLSTSYHKGKKYVYQRYICGPCNNAKMRAYRAKHKDAHNTRSRAYAIKRRRIVLAHYSDGTMRCKCCGEDTYEFLALDHKNNDGASHRGSVGQVYAQNTVSYVFKFGFPAIYQVLCHNCNMAKALHKVCPHQR